MGRHGYVDDLDDGTLNLWRASVNKAIRGKRGQKFIRDLRDALDALPSKRLVVEELVTPEGEVCALGSVGKQRGFADLAALEPSDHWHLAKRFDIARCLVMEIEYENDEGSFRHETPEQRWQRMRDWCDANLAQAKEKP